MQYYNPQEVAKRIKQARVEKRMTQRELAEAIDIAENSMYHIESGKHGISIDKLVEIAQKLQISTDFLLLGEQKETEKGLDSIWLEITNGKSEKEVAYALEVLKSILGHTNMLTT